MNFKLKVSVVFQSMIISFLCLSTIVQASPKELEPEVKVINGDSLGISIVPPNEKGSFFTIRPTFNLKVNKAPFQETLWNVRLVVDGHTLTELPFSSVLESDLQIKWTGYLSPGLRVIEVLAVAENGEISSRDKLEARVERVAFPIEGDEGAIATIGPNPGYPNGIQALWKEDDKDLKLVQVTGASQGNVILKGWGAFTYQIADRIKESTTEKLTLVLESSTGAKETRTLHLKLEPRYRPPYAGVMKHKTLSGMSYPVRLVGQMNPMMKVLEVIPPSNGTVHGSNEYLYTSNTGFSGTDRFMFYLQNTAIKAVVMGEALIEVVAADQYIPPKIELGHIKGSPYMNSPMLFFPIDSLLPLKIEDCQLLVDGEPALNATFTQKHMMWDGTSAMIGGGEKSFKISLVIEENSFVGSADENIIEEEFTVKLDAVPPKVEFIKKSEQQVFNEGTISIEATASDELSGIDYDTVKLYLNGEEVAFGANALTWSGNRKDGFHVTTVIGADKAGNFSSSSQVVVVDTSGPRIKIERFGLSNITSSREPMFFIAVNDDNTNVEIMSIEINGKEYDYGNPKDVLNEDGTWQIYEGIIEAEGEYVVKVTAWDASNFKSDKEHKIIYKPAKPLIATQVNKKGDLLTVKVNPRDGYTGEVIFDQDILRSSAGTHWTFSGNGGGLQRQFTIKSELGFDSMPVMLMGSDFVFEDEKGRLLFSYKQIKGEKGRHGYKVSGSPIQDANGKPREMKYFIEEMPKGWEFDSDTGEITLTDHGEDGMVRVWAADKEYTMIGRELNFYVNQCGCSCDPFVSVGFVTQD